MTSNSSKKSIWLPVCIANHLITDAKIIRTYLVNLSYILILPCELSLGLEKKARDHVMECVGAVPFKPYF